MPPKAAELAFGVRQTNLKGEDDMTGTATQRLFGAYARDAPDEADLMVRNGITRVRADQYHVDGYRYTSLADALAQVRRGAGKRADRP